MFNFYASFIIVSTKTTKKKIHAKEVVFLFQYPVSKLVLLLFLFFLNSEQSDFNYFYLKSKKNLFNLFLMCVFVA